MKTAMQEAFIFIGKRIWPYYDQTLTTDEIVNKFKELMLKEKQQIIDAYIKGVSESDPVIEEDPDYSDYLSAQDYYTKTFNDSHKQ